MRCMRLRMGNDSRERNKRRIEASLDWQYGRLELSFEDAYISYRYLTSGKIECGCNKPDDYSSKGSKKKKGAERT